MSEGLCRTKSLLQILQRSKGDEILKTFKALTDSLRNDSDTKEFFHNLNGVSVVLNVSVGADVGVLNCALDALAAAAEDHDGNKAKLTIDRTFIIINTILASQDSLCHTSSLRALVLLFHVCGENAEAQELANKSGCVSRMGQFFTILLEDISKSAEVKKDKTVFTWSILCTAIAAVCGQPPNPKNQECLQCVIQKSVDFLSEWIDASKDVIQEINCVKTLLIMLPYVLCDNKTNQDCFARSGGIHTVINGLIELENRTASGSEVDEIRVKLVYLLFISLMENPFTSKLAGFLGAIPLLFRLLKQLNQKDKGTILMCLSGLLNCPENEDIFNRLDVFTDLSSQIKMFAEGSECRKVIEKICKFAKNKTGVKNGDEDSVNSSVNKAKLDSIDSESTKPLSKNTRRSHDSGYKEYHMHSDRNYEKFRYRSLYPKQTSSAKDEYCFEGKSRIHIDTLDRSLNDSDSLHDEPDSSPLYQRFKKQNDERKRHPLYRDERDSLSSEDMKNFVGRSGDKTNFSRSGYNHTYDKVRNYENNFSKSMLNGHILKMQQSTSELMNKARKLYPRNKMAELEEIDTHQKRHYLTNLSELLIDDEFRKTSPQSSRERNLGDLSHRDERKTYENSRYSLDSQMSDDDLRREFRRASLEKYSKDDIKRNTIRRDTSQGSLDKQIRDYFADDEPKREHSKSLERSTRNEHNMDEEGRREHLRALKEDIIRNKYDTDDEVQTADHRKFHGSDEFIKGELRKERFINYSQKRNRVPNEEYDQNMQENRGNNPKFDIHRRSKSMGRIANLDMQSMINNLEASYKEKHSSQHTSNESNLTKDKTQYYKENFEMPKLVSARKVDHSNEDYDASLEENFNMIKERTSGFRNEKTKDKTQYYKENFEMPKLVSARKVDHSNEDYDASLEENFNMIKERTSGFSNEKSGSAYNKSKFREDLLKKADESIQSIESRDPSSPSTSAADASLNDSELIFSEDEEKYLLAGLKKFGLDFKAIHQEFNFNEKRTPHDLYEKWKCCYN